MCAETLKTRRKQRSWSKITIADMERWGFVRLPFFSNVWITEYVYKKVDFQGKGKLLNTWLQGRLVILWFWNRKKNHTVSALWLVCIVTGYKIKVSLCKIHKHVIPATIFLSFVSVWNRFSLALFTIATGPMYLVKNPVWVPSRQRCLAYNFLTSFAVLGTSFRLFQIHIRFLFIVHTFHHPPLVTQIDAVLRLNIMKSPGCNAWRDEPMCVCCNDRCVDAK